MLCHKMTGFYSCFQNVLVYKYLFKLFIHYDYYFEVMSNAFSLNFNPEQLISDSFPE